MQDIGFGRCELVRAPRSFALALACASSVTVSELQADPVVPQTGVVPASPTPQNVSPSRQDHPGKSDDKQNVTAPAVAKPPLDAAPIFPREGERNAGSHQNHGPEGDNPKGDDGPKITDWVQAVSAAVTFLATLGLLYVGRQQLETYRLQAKIMLDTREIASTALERPYVLLGTVSHNFDEWRDTEWGSNRPSVAFRFQFQNLGKSPAVVENIVAYAFISSGPWGRGTDEYPATGFPVPQQLATLLGDRPSVRVFPDTPPNDVDPVSGKFAYAIKTGTFMLRSNDESRAFNQFVRYTGNADRGNERLVEPSVRPWLIGKVQYRSLFGASHHTFFCVRGEGDGSAMEMYGPPYNERT